MPTPFDSQALAVAGWRQGAVLGPELSALAFEHAPPGLTPDGGDWIIVTSHDCDVLNRDLAKEPVVEVLRGKVTPGHPVDQQRAHGRNPRSLHVELEEEEQKLLLSCSVHDRWWVPRDVLLRERPARHLSELARRLIAEWLAKRYIRAAFPNAFDQRWRREMKSWVKLLERFAASIQGVYLRLDTVEELPHDQPYRCHILLAVPLQACRGEDWADRREALGTQVQEFWDQFAPDIECVGVEVLGVDEVTLADIEPYQRFDADWVSHRDETPVVPVEAELTG